jgi:hypothetical protein
LATLLYTTKEAIANLLRGRLQVGGTQFPFGPTTVDDNLIEQIGAQVEAKLNAQLATVFRLPLAQPQNPILASIVEAGILCRLLPTHASGEELPTAGDVGVDRSFAGFYCKAYNAELQALLNGTIALEGELPATEPEPQIARNLTIAGQRAPIISTTRIDAGSIQW